MFFKKKYIDWRTLNPKTTKFYWFVYPHHFESCIAQFYVLDFNEKDRDYFKQFFEEIKAGIDAEENIVKVRYVPNYQTHKAVQEYNFSEKVYRESYKAKVKWLLEKFMLWTTLFRDYQHNTEPVFRRNHIEFPNAPVYKEAFELIEKEIKRLDLLEDSELPKPNPKTSRFELKMIEEYDVWYLVESLNLDPTDYKRRFNSDDMSDMMKILFDRKNEFVPYKELGKRVRKRTFQNLFTENGRVNTEQLDRYFRFSSRSVQFTPIYTVGNN